jgi:hypothetical protein
MKVLLQLKKLKVKKKKKKKKIDRKKFKWQNKKNIFKEEKNLHWIKFKKPNKYQNNKMRGKMLKKK